MRTPAAENKMRMRIDKAGCNKCAACVDYFGFGTAFGNFPVSGHISYNAVIYKDGGVIYFFDLTLLFAFPGSIPFGRCKQADVFD